MLWHKDLRPQSGCFHEKSSKHGLGGAIGLAIGFAVGLGYAIYLDGAGLDPPRGWQMRLLIAAFTGGIGGLLGLVSGAPRLY